MFVFFKKENSIIAVPVSNITIIQQTQNNVSIKYHTGKHFIENADFSSSNTDVETFQIYYSDEKEAVEKMKAFYWSMAKNTGAFMF